MSALRLGLDSNVIISGFLFGGPPRRMLELAFDGSVLCFTSLPILDEIRDVLHRPKFGLSPDHALTFIEELHDLCQVVTPGRKVSTIIADPDDNIILECALAARADLIVSGDSHLLELTRWRGVDILSPASAMERIDGQPGGREIAR